MKIKLSEELRETLNVWAGNDDEQAKEILETALKTYFSILQTSQERYGCYNCKISISPIVRPSN